MRYFIFIVINNIIIHAFKNKHAILMKFMFYWLS